MSGAGFNAIEALRSRVLMGVNTRLRRASIPLKPAPDIVWCPFPLRHTRNQHSLSAITTRSVSIVNAYMLQLQVLMSDIAVTVINDAAVALSMMLHLQL